MCTKLLCRAKSNSKETNRIMTTNILSVGSRKLPYFAVYSGGVATKSMTTTTTALTNKKIIKKVSTTSKATATEGLRKTLLFGRGIRAGWIRGRNQQRDDRDTTVPLPLTGMSPLRVFEETSFFFKYTGI